jgi:hypothetical protein
LSFGISKSRTIPTNFSRLTIPTALSLSPIGTGVAVGNMQQHSREVAELNGRFRQLDNEQKKISGRLVQQQGSLAMQPAFFAKVIDPNRALAAIKDSLQSALGGGYHYRFPMLPSTGASFKCSQARIANIGKQLRQLLPINLS